MKAATREFNPDRFETKFQSTPPVKAATLSPHSAALPGAISIHAAREGGDAEKLDYQRLIEISIHAAREGGDEGGKLEKNLRVISIHAAREGGDAGPVAQRCEWSHFNPRRP